MSLAGCSRVAGWSLLCRWVVVLVSLGGRSRVAGVVVLVFLLWSFLCRWVVVRALLGGRSHVARWLKEFKVQRTDGNW